VSAIKTLVIGLGNPILTDDGVGVRVADAVRSALETEGTSGVSVIEASVGGLRLMEMMIGADRVILVDALAGENQGCVGAIRRMTLEELKTISPTQHIASAHDTTLVTALEAGRVIGLHLPEEIIVYAIEVANVTEFGDEPTPDVAAAIPKATAAVLAEIRGTTTDPIGGSDGIT